MRMNRVLGWIVLILLSACASWDGLPTATAPKDELIQQVSDDMSTVKTGLGSLREFCRSVNVDPTAEDPHTAGLLPALSNLLADPRSADYDLDTLRDIFIQGAQYTDLYFYPGSGATFVVSFKSFVCMPTSNRFGQYQIYVMNRRGQSWHIGTTGGFPWPDQVQWAGDRWVIAYNRPVLGGPPPTLMGIWQVMLSEAGWHIAVDSPLDVPSWPRMTLKDGYQRIAMRFDAGNTSACKISPALTADANYISYEIERTYEWQSGSYVPIDETVIAVDMGLGKISKNAHMIRIGAKFLRCNNVGAEVRLAWDFHKLLPPKPDVNPCSADFDPGVVDGYNEAQKGALTQMLAAPEAKTLSDSELMAAFNRVTRMYGLNKESGFFLIVVEAWQPQCMAGRHGSNTLNLYVMNDQGDAWNVGSLRGAEGNGALIRSQWLEDRWIAVVNNSQQSLCGYCYSVWQITKAGEGWTSTDMLDLGTATDSHSQWVNVPILTALDGYRQIALDLSPQYADAPCTFTPSIAKNLYMTWKAVRRIYVWQPNGYEQVDEQIVSTNVIIQAREASGNMTYQRLENWEAFCISDS